MKARAHIVAERRGELTEITGRRAEAPLAVRRCGERVLLAATAAAPVGGDELTIDVEVGAGATLHLGSVAATMVWPAADGARSATRTTCDVGPAATLVHHPEPTVVVAGSRHRIETVVHLAAGARCFVVDEFALGRTAEPSGDVDVEWRVERDGRPLLHHAEQFGPSAPAGVSAVSVGAARFVMSAVVVGVPAGRPRTELDRGAAAALLPLGDDAVLLLAIGADRPSAWDIAAAVAPDLVPDYGMTIRPTFAAQRTSDTRPAGDSTETTTC